MIDSEENFTYIQSDECDYVDLDLFPINKYYDNPQSIQDRLSAVMEKYINLNPYPSVIPVVRNEVTSDTSYMWILSEYICRLDENNIDIDRFINEFEIFFINDILPIKDSIQFNELNHLISVLNPMLYIRLFTIICKYDKMFASTISLYRIIVLNIIMKPNVQYIDYLLECCDPSLLLLVMERNIYNVTAYRYELSNEQKTEIAKQFKCMVDNGIDISSNTNVSGILLRIAFDYDCIELFEYLLSIGCRPGKNTKKEKLYSSMKQYALDAADIAYITIPTKIEMAIDM